MTPLERAARVLCEQHLKRVGRCKNNDVVREKVEEYWPGHLKDASVVLTAIREPIDDAIEYLLADAEAWEKGSEGAPHREFLMHSGKLRRDLAARLQAMIDAALAEGE